jgi:hypothetical protein
MPKIKKQNDRKTKQEWLTNLSKAGHASNTSGSPLITPHYFEYLPSICSAFGFQWFDPWRVEITFTGLPGVTTNFSYLNVESETATVQKFWPVHIRPHTNHISCDVLRFHAFYTCSWYGWSWNCYGILFRSHDGLIKRYVGGCGEMGTFNP